MNQRHCDLVRVPLPLWHAPLYKCIESLIQQGFSVLSRAWRVWVRGVVTRGFPLCVANRSFARRPTPVARWLTATPLTSPAVLGRTASRRGHVRSSRPPVGTVNPPPHCFVLLVVPRTCGRRAVAAPQTWVWTARPRGHGGTRKRPPPQVCLFRAMTRRGGGAALQRPPSPCSSWGNNHSTLWRPGQWCPRTPAMAVRGPA